jgi:CheY-like chemotaxis protein
MLRRATLARQAAVSDALQFCIFPTGDRFDRVSTVAAPPAPRKSVVVIDDDPDLTFVICTVLEDDGYWVVCYTQTSLALESVVENQPDLVILDWWLSERSGQTLLSALRDDPRTAHVPVLVCTADATVLDCRDELARNGADPAQTLRAGLPVHQGGADDGTGIRRLPCGLNPEVIGTMSQTPKH